MLIYEPRIFNPEDPTIVMLKELMGQSSEIKELQKGIHQIGSFGLPHSMRKFYEEYFAIGDHYSYGVCDSAEQLLAAIPEIQNSDDEFIVTLTAINKADQPPKDGWRWEKWGEYVGTQKPQADYLYNEPQIERVFVYHIYKRLTSL
jgi:hypothetical protein